jgi:uncharacterized protein (TIGR02266 family)
MSVERRKAHRAAIPGMRVVFEGAEAERVETDVLNVSSGGMFIRTSKPLPVGKRLSLEIEAVADVGAWSALGRIVWTREKETPTAAPGMGVKLIDVDDAVVANLDRLVAARESQRVATAVKAPERERTVLGLGTPARPPPRERSVQEPPEGDWDLPEGLHDVHGMPTRQVVVPQRVVTVVSMPEDVPPQTPPPARELSIAIDLVARKPAAEVEAVTRVEERPLPRRDGPEVRAADGVEQEAPSAPAPRRRRSGWLLFLLVVAAAAAALYSMRDSIPWVQRLVEPWTASPPAPTPVAPIAPMSPTGAALPAPTIAASPSQTGAPSQAPRVSPVPSKVPARAVPTESPSAAPTKRLENDNPY